MPEETVDTVAFRKTADQYNLTDEERQDPRMAKLIRGTTAYVWYACGETIRRFNDALQAAGFPFDALTTEEETADAD